MIYIEDFDLYILPGEVDPLEDCYSNNQPPGEPGWISRDAEESEPRYIHQFLASLSADQLDSFERRFWALVDIEGPDECWPWQGAQNGQGYGLCALDDRNVCAAHVVSYILGRSGWTIGVEPPLSRGHGEELHHTCKRRICCNPAHIERKLAVEHRRVHNCVTMHNHGPRRITMRNR
jgi:hypothetical protein